MAKTKQITKAEALMHIAANPNPELVIEQPSIKTTHYDVIVKDVEGELMPPNRWQQVNNELDGCEQDLDHTGQQVGKLLSEIKTDKLYLAEHKSFEDYLSTRRNRIYRGTALRWIAEYEVNACLMREAQEWSIELTEMPSQNAAQHLARIKHGALMFATWLKLVKQKTTTAEDVKQAVDAALKGKEAEPTPEPQCKAAWKVDAGGESLLSCGGWDERGKNNYVVSGELPAIYKALRKMIDYCEQHNIRPVVSCK